MASSSRRTRASSLLAVFGPTASGKTAVAGVLRDRLGAEVVSADSAALYAGLPVITAAPPYPARLVGTVPLSEKVSVVGYQRWAHEAIDTAGRPLLVGGTGLYFLAAVSSLVLPPPVAAERRAHWQAEYDRLGSLEAHARLGALDAPAARRVHPNDRRRVVRALELAEAGGSLAPRRDLLRRPELRMPTTIVALELPLAELDRRIEERTRAMACAGAAEEARRAWSGPLSETARKVLGLEQFATLPREEAVNQVARATRRLARYQRTWVRRLPGVVRLDANRAAEEVAAEIVALAGAGEHLPRQ